jgi:uncharacterized membrane protein
MPWEKIFESVATLASGIFSGAAAYITLVEHPARMECGTRLAATEFGPSYRRASVMQPLLAIIGFLAATIAWLMGGSPWWLVGGLLLVSVIPFTLIVIMPTNKRLLDPGLDRDSEPARRLLTTWGRLHAVRTVVSIISFLIFLGLMRN